MTKNKITTLACYSVMYQDGKSETLFLTPAEYAGYKRSKRYKDRITCRKLATVSVNIKITIA